MQKMKINSFFPFKVVKCQKWPKSNSIRATGFKLLDCFYFCIQLYLLLSSSLCFIFFLYPDLYLLGDNTLIS